MATPLAGAAAFALMAFMAAPSTGAVAFKATLFTGDDRGAGCGSPLFMAGCDRFMVDILQTQDGVTRP